MRPIRPIRPIRPALDRPGAPPPSPCQSVPRSPGGSIGRPESLTAGHHRPHVAWAPSGPPRPLDHSRLQGGPHRLGVAPLIGLPYDFRRGHRNRAMPRAFLGLAFGFAPGPVLAGVHDPRVPLQQQQQSPRGTIERPGGPKKSRKKGACALKTSDLNKLMKLKEALLNYSAKSFTVIHQVASAHI